MGLRNFLCGLFDCQSFKDHDNKLAVIGTNVAAVLAIVQAGMASPLTWWVNTPASVQGQFELELLVKGSQLWKFTAYGAEIVFDPLALTLESVDLGELNAGWSLEGENEISPGRVRFGAVAGSAPPVEGEITGSFTRFRFITVAGFTGETEIKVENAVDDFAALSPQPLRATLSVE